MEQTKPAIALKRIGYLGGGALLVASAVLGGRAAVADLTLTQELESSGTLVVTETGESIETRNDSVAPSVTDKSSAESESEATQQPDGTKVERSTEQISVSISVEQPGAAGEPTSTIVVNGDTVATPPAATAISVDVTNRGSLDGSRNESVVEIDHETSVDTEQSSRQRTRIRRDINAGNNDIRGEEQDVGDIIDGTVRIDLNGL
ncbi:MAG: hypothetical protein ACOYBJ_00150 [Patescibacteria group bacterium]|jgi:hypothetical protein